MKIYLKRVLAVFLAIAAVIGFSVVSTAAENEKNYYYIDSVDGDDSNSGTDINHPIKTLLGLKNPEFGPGTHFLFKNGGEYECAVTLTCSGTKENPIVISSYGEGEKAVLYTNEKTDVFRFFDCSYVTVSNLHIKAPNGGGIWIDTLDQTSEGIVIENVYFTDMQNYRVNSRDDFSNGASGARAAVMVKGLPARSRYAVNNLIIKNCEVYNCGNGFIIWGSWNDKQEWWCKNEEDIDPIFNKGLLIEGCYLHEMDAEAVLVGMCDGALVTNCRAINCCQGPGTNENGEILYYTAAMWFWGSVNSTIQYCEIAGQKNVGDGMAIDFDSYSHNCTYQYIYSHDNMRFICNCPFHSGHKNNTVRYCLSVNDNGGRSRISANPGEHGLKFYNNTIVNCADFYMIDMYDSVIANNIIVPAEGYVVVCDIADYFRDGNVFANNCYYNTVNPLCDIGSLNTVPGFVGSDLSAMESFALSADSPLIGAGVEVEGNDLETDIFGNKITGNNIGCYGGNGEDCDYEGEGLIEKIIRIVKNIINRIVREREGLKDY